MKLSSLLGHARELLELIHTSGSPADSVIDSFFRSRKYLGSHDRRFLAETVYGTLRHLRRCDAVLRKVTREVGSDVPHEDGFLLLVLVYLLHCERRTTVLAKEILPLFRSSRIKRGLEAMLQGVSTVSVLEDHEPVGRIGIEHSFPEWMVEKLVAQFGAEEADKICASLNQQAPTTVRVNTLKGTVEECQRSLEEEGVAVRRTNLSPVGLELQKRVNVFQLEAFRRGLFEVQDEGSQLLPLLVDPKPTAKVLDACAGAGGKTLEFAALMRNRGEIVAVDISSFRLAELRKRAKRAGVSNVRTKEVSALGELAPHYPGYFDIAFIDAPCSGVGTIRRNPGMKWTLSGEAVRELSVKQEGILEATASLVKKGGQLVYATCSLLREENEDVIERFLQRHSEFILIDPTPIVQRADLHLTVSGGFLTLLPHRDGTDGFFCAVLERQKT